MLFNDFAEAPYTGVSQANSGHTNLWNKINKNNMLVIWSKTIHLGPKLENSATAIQSNLNGQYSFSTYVPYNKFVTWDPTQDGSLNDLPSSPEPQFYMWYDDPLRAAGQAGDPASFLVKGVGSIVTYFKDGNNLR